MAKKFQEILAKEYKITLKHFLLFIGLAFVSGVFIGLFGSVVAWLIIAFFIMVLTLYVAFKVVPLFLEEKKEST